MYVGYDSNKFVNVYLIDRAYGGPEEGGWYFECGQFIGGRAVDSSDEYHINLAVEVAKEECEKMNEGRRSDISSVLSEGKYVVYVEENPGADFPTHRPHYE